MSITLASARAPSNIALIKYMGKKPYDGTPGSGNLPENPSLSMTLKSLCTVAEISRTPQNNFSFQWIAEAPPGPGQLPFQVPNLGELAQKKAQTHIERIVKFAPEILKGYGIETDPRALNSSFTLRSANTFPAASGIASSASAFAALTLATSFSLVKDRAAFEKCFTEELKLKRALAALSREGSGSSCRSFEGPFVHWVERKAVPVPTSLPEMAHFVLLISQDEKEVSSSEAHQRVKTSPLWEGRVARVEKRAATLISALASGDLPVISRIAWTESWEMHSLFHTASETFSYWRPRTVEILEWLSGTIKSPNPPIVTMDAGPNIHLIVPAYQAAKWKASLTHHFPEIPLLSDQQGTGATTLDWEIR